MSLIHTRLILRIGGKRRAGNDQANEQKHFYWKQIDSLNRHISSRLRFVFRISTYREGHEISVEEIQTFGESIYGVI